MNKNIEIETQKEHKKKISNIKKEMLAIIMILLIGLFSYIIVSIKDKKNAVRYNNNAMKIEFFKEAKNIEYSATLYLLNNGTDSKEEFKLETAIKDTNKILSKENWEKLKADKPNIFDGKWFLNKEGRLKFKFKKAILEPNWINNPDVSEYIEAN